MTHQEIREKFKKFFKAREHTWVSSSSLLPDDPSVLFTTAGMQQFKKYYTGELDAKKAFRLPDGTSAKGTASIQKCIRTSDIDEVGDESHLTFFEMLGNFSFDGYGKTEAIKYAHEFITSPDWMNLKIEYVTVFEGWKSNGLEIISPDKDSEKIWKSIDTKIRIEKGDFNDNFWGPTGDDGPCGPTTEIYVNGVEIWNIVFNEYYKSKDSNDYKPLPRKGIDTGMGLERLAMVAQDRNNIFETDLFSEAFGMYYNFVPDVSHNRIFMDHLRAVCFMISDGFRPSNKEGGYVLRRLIRRVITIARTNVGTPSQSLNGHLNEALSKAVLYYGNVYRGLIKNQGEILDIFNKEFQIFSKTLEQGLKEFYRRYPKLQAQRLESGKPIKVHQPEKISGKDAFDLHQSYGFTLDVLKDLGRDGLHVIDEKGFNKEFQKHQEKSRAGVEKKFGGHGLILNTGELKAVNEEELKKVTRLHTATHLLQQALRTVLGDAVQQAGSDITVGRTRFDFSYPQKMTEDEKKKVEDIVNEKIHKDLPMQKVTLPKAEAEKIGALYLFNGKYPDPVDVYFVGETLETAFSKEFCGGPHVEHTGEIGKFKIIKEESVSSGVRRIRATVE